MTTLAQHVFRAAGHAPSAAALVSPRGSWDYGELLALTEAGALELLRQGFAPGDMAALASGNTDLALAALAASAAGVAFLPLDPATAARRFPALQALAPGRLRAMERLPSFGQGARRAPPAEVALDAPALVIATSGSEGEPKAVRLSHRNLDTAAAAANGRLPLGPGDVWLACLPLFHIGGQAILHRAFRAGAGVRLHENFDAQAVLRELHEHPVSHLSLVPAMLARLLESSPTPPPATLRYVLVGGSALPYPLFERAQDMGWPVCPSYGMSECASQVATLVRPKDWREGNAGFPLSGLEVAIGPDRRIRLRGPQVMLGYLGQASIPEDGWFLTSDLGEMDEEGRLRVLGRADDMLVSGGKKLHPLALESRLSACPGVAEVAITALPDPVWGERLVALVVGAAEPEQVRRWSREHLSSPERPREVMKVAGLPRNTLGKLERALLPALAGAAP